MLRIKSFSIPVDSELAMAMISSPAGAANRIQDSNRKRHMRYIKENYSAWNPTFAGSFCKIDGKPEGCGF